MISGVIFEFWRTELPQGLCPHQVITGRTLCNLGVWLACSEAMKLVLGDGAISRVWLASTSFCKKICLFPALLICCVSLSKTLHLNQTLSLYGL